MEGDVETIDLTLDEGSIDSDNDRRAATSANPETPISSQLLTPVNSRKRGFGELTSSAQDTRPYTGQGRLSRSTGSDSLPRFQLPSSLEQINALLSIEKSSERDGTRLDQRLPFLTDENDDLEGCSPPNSVQPSTPYAVLADRPPTPTSQPSITQDHSTAESKAQRRHPQQCSLAPSIPDTHQTLDRTSNLADNETECAYGVSPSNDSIRTQRRPTHATDPPAKMDELFHTLSQLPRIVQQMSSDMEPLFRAMGQRYEELERSMRELVRKNRKLERRLDREHESIGDVELKVNERIRELNRRVEEVKALVEQQSNVV